MGRGVMNNVTDAVKKIFRYQEATLALIIIALMAVLTFNNPQFLSFENIMDMLKSNSVLGITALGVLIVINTGGIDVSVGALIAMVTVLIARFMLAVSGNPLLVFAVGLLSGTAMGAINGMFVAKFKIPSIIVTLAAMTILNGILRWYTNGAWISGLPAQFTDIGSIVFFRTVNENGAVTGVPIQILFLLIAAGLTAFLLRYPIIGRGILAMGGNSVSSERIGFSNDNITIFAFAFSGFMCALAAIAYTTIMKTVDSNAFFGFELRAIGAVVLGGAAITGGSGTVVGTILGMFLLSIVNNGLVMTRVSTYYQKIIIGAIILFTVSFDVIKTKRQERRFVKVDID
jgi:simple sugar transport system permease protein/ribose transport system permease protein